VDVIEKAIEKDRASVRKSMGAIMTRAPTTLHEHFKANPLWFDDFGAYCRLHEHFRADPRGAESFGQWIEDRIWELLQRPGRLEYLDRETGRWWAPTFDETTPRTIEECLDRAIFDPRAMAYRRRVAALLDGTVIREWVEAK
jgi:hypothetical protein